MNGNLTQRFMRFVLEEFPPAVKLGEQIIKAGNDQDSDDRADEHAAGSRGADGGLPIAPAPLATTNGSRPAMKALSQRFDFKGTEAEVERNEDGIVVRASEDDRVRAAIVVLQEKLIRRKVSLKHFDVPKKAEKGPKGSSRILIKVQEGIEADKAREIVKLIKDSKLKVQAAIQDLTVRISGKKRDDLQAAMQVLRGAEALNLDLQFTNFRD